MKKIGIMADSHSGILKQEAEELDIHVLPMPFYLNRELFQENLNFSRKEFYEKLRKGASTLPNVMTLSRFSSAFHVS